MTRCNAVRRQRLFHGIGWDVVRACGGARSGHEVPREGDVPLGGWGRTSLAACPSRRGADHRRQKIGVKFSPKGFGCDV